MARLSTEALRAILCDEESDEESLISIVTPVVWRIPVNYTSKQLIYAIKHAKAHPNDFYQTSEWASHRMTASQYLAWFRRCLNAKINRDRKRYGRKDGGDNYMSDYERSTMQIARRVNTPRLIVRKNDVPFEFKGRLAHRIYQEENF